VNVNDALSAVNTAIEKNGELAELIGPVKEYAEEAAGVMATALGADHEATLALGGAEERAGTSMGAIAATGAELQALKEYLERIQ